MMNMNWKKENELSQLMDTKTVTANKSECTASGILLPSASHTGIIPALSTLNISFTEGMGFAYAYLIAFQSLETWRNIYPSALFFVHGAENHPIIGSAIALYSSIGVSVENPDGIVRATVDVDTHYSVVPLLGRTPDKFEIVSINEDIQK